MPAGQVIIKQFIDGADGPQNIAYWSDDGTPTGNLSPIVQATGVSGGTGDASAAKQDIGNASLANIDADIGATSDTAATSDAGTFSLIALFKRLLRFGATTREYAPSNGYRLAVGASASTIAISGNITLATSREVRVRASTACWIRFATAGTGQDAAVPTSGSATTSMPIDANQAEVLRIPAACTHLSVIRDSADGAITFTPVA